MRLFIVLFPLIFLIQCNPDNKVHFVDTTFDQALVTAEKAGKKVLIDFWADG